MDILSFIEQLSAAPTFLGLIGVAAIANLFPGLPEELPLLLIGVTIGSGIIPLYIAFPAVFITLFSIDTAIYFASRRGAKWVVWAQKKIFGESLDVSSPWVQKNIKSIAFWSRFMLHLRPLGPFLSGVNKLPYTVFIVYEGTALAIYILIMFGLGSYFQERIQVIADGVGVLKSIIGISICVFILFFASRIFYSYFMRKLKGKELPKWVERFGITKRE